MTMRTFIALVAFIGIQSLVALWLNHSLQETRHALSDTTASLEVQKAAVVALQTSQRALQAEVGRVSIQNQEYANALQATIDGLPDRGTRRTPQPVVDRLCKRLKCAQSDD